MDAKLFRLPTKPNFYGDLQSAQPVDIRTSADAQQLPAPDSRFPGWAAPMSDARLVTDYRPHCSKNIPTGRQFPTKVWMQRNGSEIIEASRRIMATNMGAQLPFDGTVVPPPLTVVDCKPGECSRISTGAPNAIGVERRPEPVPELFGTFEPKAGWFAKVPERHVGLTTRFEGGRNTPRGRQGPVCGVVTFDSSN